MKNYALVYLVDDDSDGCLTDVGNDPCFDSPPSWGICRPDVRNEKEVREGSVLLFIARVFIDGERKYFVKGYFRIKTKINVIEAYDLLGNRENIIISNEKAYSNEKWDNKTWEKHKNSKSDITPIFLKEFKWNGQVYYQRKSDNHGVDNWKCRRIFNCYKPTFIDCLDKGFCQKEDGRSELKRNYILGDENEFKDWSKLRVQWKEIAKLIGKSDELIVANKHPEVELTDNEIETDTVLKSV